MTDRTAKFRPLMTPFGKRVNRPLPAAWPVDSTIAADNLSRRDEQAGLEAMKGEVIYFDAERGTGFVSGADGNRYVFDATDIVPAGGRVARGASIAFEGEGDRARKISAESPPAPAKALIDPGSGGAPLDPYAEPAPSGLFGYFRRCITAGYARFGGRARRREYWAFMLFSIIGFAIAGGIGFVLGTALGFSESDQPTVSAVAVGIFGLFLVLPSLAVLIRRLHDIGLSGWFTLLGFLPMVGSLIILVFTLIASQKHENKWGAIPAGVRPG